VPVRPFEPQLWFLSDDGPLASFGTWKLAAWCSKRACLVLQALA
jgi:hypothetical protein